MVEPAFGNVHEYSVSELAGAVKRSIEDGFGFVRVRGELGRISRPGSGHVYLDLKDDRASLSGVIWKANAERMAVRPEEGMEVVVTGRLTTFPGQSKYQIIIDSLEPAGAGALMALLEARKQKLAAEGLFDPARKRPLPFLPDVIGVVTSPSGAVIRDILHRLRERFPRHVIVWPTLVQGRGAEEKIAAAIRGFNALKPGGAIPRPDVLIVARGGGSLEDLWCFNEEIVARAVAASGIPVISAVGHETDTTLIDFVADLRAPTPTAAAEKAVPMRSDLIAEVLNKARRMVAAQSRSFEGARQGLLAASRGLGRPQDVIGAAAQRLDRAGDRLRAGLEARQSAARTRLASAAGRFAPAILATGTAERRARLAILSARLAAAGRMNLTRRAERLARARLPARALQTAATQAARDALRINQRLRAAGQILIPRRAEALAGIGKLLVSYSHQNVLERGFALIRDPEGRLVRSAREPQAGAPIRITFADGDRAAKVEPFGDPPHAGARPVRPSSPTRPTSPRPAQKSLFDE